MDFDRVELYSALNFMVSVIPKDAKNGKNCLFVRVEDGKLILTAGGEFTNKKAVIVSQNTTTGTGLPEKFMIPRADLFAFQEMMKEHKAVCKNMDKNPDNHVVSITDSELKSHDAVITYNQPKHLFKDLEPLFQIKMDHVSSMPIMKKEMTAILTGFKDSARIDVTYSGDGKAVHFEQGDFEAILIPPIEKEDKDQQKTIDD